MARGVSVQVPGVARLNAFPEFSHLEARLNSLASSATSDRGDGRKPRVARAALLRKKRRPGTRLLRNQQNIGIHKQSGYVPLLAAAKGQVGKVLRLNRGLICGLAAVVTTNDDF